MPRVMFLILLGLLSLTVPACVTRSVRSTLNVPGDNVLDVDRGVPLLLDAETGFPLDRGGGGEGAGGPSGAGGLTFPRRAYSAILPPPSRPLVAGPMQPQTNRVELTRSVQRALTERGYFHGPINGLSDAELVGALARFQTDHGLPSTGGLDGATASALRIVAVPQAPPAAPPPSSQPSGAPSSPPAPPPSTPPASPPSGRGAQGLF